MSAGAPSASDAIGLSRANLVRAIRLPRSGTASAVIPQHWPSGRSCSPAVSLTSPRERVRAGGGGQPLRHPVVDVAEAVEALSLVLDEVEEGAPVELHVGESSNST